MSRVPPNARIDSGANRRHYRNCGPLGTGSVAQSDPIPPRSPDCAQLAENVNVRVGTSSDPQHPTLTVTYPARGQKTEEACRFALALFERDCNRHSLPDRLTAE